ncbi:MAG: dihydrolipoyl dehydrogenase [Gammaproteobacteria bacterium]|nr:MAG: dihydrolipoyl dehydrogenase [Gammaproteobacteria bacterium]
MSRVDLTIPDIGNFTDVSVVDVLVKAGDVIAIDSPLVTLETDKASMDVPATAAGTIAEVLLKRGDKVSKGSLIARVEAGTAAVSAASPSAAATSAPAARQVPGPEPRPAAPPASRAPAARRESAGDTVRMPTPGSGAADRASQDFNRSTQLLVLGAGPGGYTAAFRAADLGLKVTLVERWQELGGVCLNVGCIPSKALLHAAKVIEDAEEMGARGIAFGSPQLDLQRLRAWKSSVVAKLTGGLKVLVKQRKVDVVRGTGRFVSQNVLEVMGASGSQRIHFDQCIIAAGSEPARLAGLPDDPRIFDSTDALELPSFSGGLLVVGGGIIGLEMACVYDALGVRVSCDPDLVRPLERRIRSRYEQILLGTRVAGIERDPGGLRVSFTGDNAPAAQIFGRVLVAVGRTPNGHTLGAELAGVKVSERGFIPVDRQMRTNVPHIFAIGDIAAPPLLAHKAMHEGKVAAEVAAGHKRAFDVRVIPSVAYTDPEIAWVGLTETDAPANGTAFRKGAFPWVANGRSLSLGRAEGVTKLLFDPDSHRVLGGGVVGTNAGELISEIALAVENGCDAADIGLTIHPHPTLSETVAGAAEAVEGTLTDLYVPRK